LLRLADVNAIADVRSSPYSRQFPHFSREALANELRIDGVAYVYLGKELGGRPSDRRLYCEGVADYELMSKSEEFKKGVDRVLEGAGKYKIALMCSERDPLDCHRCLLVSRALAKRNIVVRHILSDGQLIDHSQIEEALLEASGKVAEDFFAPRAERLDEAYRKRSRKVAFSESDMPQTVRALHRGEDSDER
jgi:uncharacterized protein (DUF488 family)